MGPQSHRSPSCENFGTLIGEPETKWHLGASPVASHKVYYKGEGGGFPQVRAMVNFVSSSSLVACPSTKSAPTMYQTTCCLVLCRSMWVIKCLSFLLSPISKLQHALLSSKCYEPWNLSSTPCFCVVFISDSHLSLSRSLRACHAPSPTFDLNVDTPWKTTNQSP
jgi:hypothetical protein